MRTLYIIPILHSEVETLREARKNFAKIPKEYRKPFLDFVNSYWDEIEAEISKYEVQRVYLDGYSGEPLGYLALHAKKGSRVSRTVLNLISKGVILEQTEEKPLVSLMHSGYAKLESLEGITLKEIDKELIPVVLSRDLFIRRNIRNTLKDEEKGMYFYGLAHFYLDYGDIKVVEVYPRQKLKQELLKSGIYGRIMIDQIERHEKLLELLITEGIFASLEDYVEHPEKYGCNYPI